MPTLTHRGRIQAQGAGLEESVSWCQEKPPTRDEGLAMLKQLEAQLSPPERQIRASAIDKARQFIINAGNNNGVDAPVSRTYKVKGTRDIRIDIEIITGKAFTEI